MLGPVLASVYVNGNLIPAFMWAALALFAASFEEYQER